MVKHVCVAVLAATLLAAGALCAQVPAPAEEEIIPEWLYGEVVSVDAAGKNILVRYLDYNTDIEKQDVVFVDDKTLLEGVRSLQDVKPQDTLSIDYVVDAAGKFRAVAVSLETFEDDVEPELEELMPEPEKVGPAPGS